MSDYSFDNNDDASFRPHHSAQPAQRFQSARGQGYSVASGTAYLPPREPFVNAGPELHYGGDIAPQGSNSYQHPSTEQRLGRTDHERIGQRNLMDVSPQRLPHLPVQTPSHQDARPPPPPPHRAGGQYGVPLAAVGAVGGGASVMAADTAYHGSQRYDPTYQADPFRDDAAYDGQVPDHDFPDDPRQPMHDNPFMQPEYHATNTVGPALGMAGAENYEMRPALSQRPSSYTDPYGHGYRNDSHADLGTFDPRDIADDEDDAAYLPKKRAAAAAGGTAVAVGGSAILGSRDASGQYGKVPGGDPEKTSRLASQGMGSRRKKFMVGSVIGFIIILAIIGGVVGGVLYSNNSKKSAAGAGTEDDDGPDLNKNSDKIKSLMNNPDLHKIFPGMDYNPFNAQYPECLTWPPSQNNITKDVAVLSQLTPKIRLYGTDCNQTEMVLHAIDVLDMKDSVKVWLGVYLNGNQTTNDRQLKQMWKILDDFGPDPFAGLIVGNEVLFSEFLKESELISIIDSVRKDLVSRGIKFPVATSDLGSNWKPYPKLVEAVDIVMGNVHPFFGGVEAAQAASWTNTYFTDNDVSAAQAVTPPRKALIAEVGWPSQGGNYCTNPSNGMNVTCSSSTAGAVAGTEEMNRFLQDWACPALDNGTDYFWFEAFDEPWKERFNNPGAEWETEWGLLDIARNIKPGLKIPDCGGKTAS